MKHAYIAKRLNTGKLQQIIAANKIITEYQAQGFELTLRQLYYQFVARGLIENNMREYKKLGEAINDGRLCGLIDWEAIVDRTRNIQGNPHWDSTKQFMNNVIPQFATDKWMYQDERVEVWIEKDALAGVIESVCRRNDVSYFSCRGYTSQSELWSAAMRLKQYEDEGQITHVIHLGDHDPSGIDMTRDIQDRLKMFGADTEVHRIALNMNQVEQYSPPPNPAKLTDSRADKYIERFGRQSWELDALEPRMLDRLIESHILKHRDDKSWDKAVREQEKYRKELAKAAKEMK